MPECPFCGESAETEDRFCGRCGAEILDRPVTKNRRQTVPVMSLAEVCRRLGSVYYRRGSRREALEAWMKSLELEPDHEDTRARVEKVRAECAGK
jgi:predicted nucleic acid-binding Zn ribbon protein